MVVLVLCLCFFLLCIQLCLFLCLSGQAKTFRTKMSSLMAWLIGSVTGARGEDKPAEASNQVTATSKGTAKTDIKQNKSKVKQRVRKPNEEPTFNTKLSSPIEDIIEETLNEDKSDGQSSSQTSEKFVGKSKKKGKAPKQEKSQSKSDEEGKQFVFVKHTPSTSTKNQKKQASTINKAESNVSDQNVDDIGYSFLPVKERNRKGKNKSLLETKNSEETLTAVIAQGITKKKDHLIPSIIDHYKNKSRNHSPPREDNPPLDSFQDSVPVNQQQSKSEVKESKKVTSKVSYANIVSNSIPEDINISDSSVAPLNKLEAASSSVEVLSEYSEDSDEVPEVIQSVESDLTSIVNDSTEKNSELDKQTEIDTLNQEQSQDLFHNQNTGESTVESSIDIIQKPGELLQENSSNGISEVAESLKESFIDNYIDNHFTQSHKISTEDYPLEINDQLLKDAIDQLVGEDDSELLTDSQHFQEDFEAINPYLTENNQKFVEEANSSHITDNQLLEHNLTSASKDSYSEEKSHFIAEEFLSEQNEELGNVDYIGYFSTAEDSSKLLQDFIAAEIQEELTNNFSTLGIHQEDVEQSDAQQSAEPVEEAFHLTTENIQDSTGLTDKLLIPNLDAETYIEDQIQDLEDQILEQPFIVEEIDTIVSDLNSDVIVSNLLEGKFVTEDLPNSSKQEKDSFEKIEDFIFAEAQNKITESTEKHNQNTSSEINFENYTEDQIQDLEDQIAEKPFTIEETEITVSDIPILSNLVSVEPRQEDIEVEASQSDYTNEELATLDMTQIRVLTLNAKEHQESTIYRIEKKFILQFRLGPSLLGRKIKLYCNYPREVNGTLEEFSRGCYQLLNWCQDEGCKYADDTASFAQIVAKIAGSFHYYFVYENENTEERQGSGYFIVDPVLQYGDNEELPLDCIQCQTVLAKHLGPFSTWENKLSVAKESGYNVIHFTPIQELGASKSCYSLSEQLKLNPMFNEENGKKPTFEDLEQFTTKMRKEWKVLSVCDIVLNHTANESEWIKEHPEATYNCVNCPYMRPAYLFDAAFHQFSMDVKKNFYEDRGIPAEVSTEDHLNAIRYHFKVSVLEPLKIYELFTVNVKKYLEEFLTLSRKTTPINDNEKESLPEIEIVQDPQFKRLGSTIDLNLALKKYNSYRLDCFDEESRVKRCAEDLKVKLNALNEILIKEVSDDLNAAIDNVIAGIRYFRVQADGPKFKEITISSPLAYRYFTDFGSPKTIEEHEEIMFSENGKFLMAHNGWVMNSDPLKNFADAGTKTYLRRELIAWGDSVKLRFGNRPEDSPFLWDYMRKYVEQTVKIFDGVRLDNCHSTPIPVAEYLLDCARKIRPDLYVVAELFTNSDLTDNIFVNRLGITSLIREAMSAWDSHEEGRLVYRYGGVPVGSFYQPNVRPLVPMVAHAMFLDLTHDNPSPVEKRSVFDLLPSTALVNMACCASGSNRGYDELVPHHIHVVDETRQYTEWSDDESLTVGNAKYVNGKSGIIAAKRALNELHFKLGLEGYNQVYVDQMDPDIVAVTRHNPDTHTSYVLVAFTAFGHPDVHAGNYQRGIKPLRVEGVLDEIVLEASMKHIGAKSGGSGFNKFENFAKDSKWINGLSEYYVNIKQHIQANQSDIFEEVNSGASNVIQLNFKDFKPGSVAVIRVSLPEDMNEAVSKIRALITKLSVKKSSELSNIISRMPLPALNRALYRCDQEEQDEGNGFSVYNIPNYGPLCYAGFQGFMSLLANIRPNNDLGHPFCANLRDGNWMIEYVWKRLKLDEGTKELGQWVEENTKHLQHIPKYLIPCYFDVIVTGVYIALLEQSYNLMSDFVKHGSTFVKGLSLGSLQFAAYIKSANLPTLSPNLAEPKPPTRKNEHGETVQACVTLSAGLPHFSVGYMRNWGRDTFIALRGLFILTGRFEEARQHILGYAACLRHGLIPNLLDGGRNSRFNCRDALWWWLYCIKSYCDEAPNGIAILSDLVSRIFPTDDSDPQQPGAVDQPLHDVIQEALKIHFQGLKFRERNAGRQIDEQMTDAGFNNQIGIHPETGFVFGGNQWNCGTWMDKMGSSDKAGNKGKPATPRDGSAIELVGLSKATASWLWKLNREGKYPYDGIERLHKNGATTKWTFKEWADKIQYNFEKNFWIDSKLSPHESRPDLINKKSIYKDCFGASQQWTDYQLRCNVPIAMVAAPEMFDPQHAWAALEQTEQYLLGPLGMKTLDPEDWNYRGDYDNSNDSTDFHLSNGFNYHQGPEWVWPIGFFLRAKLIFAAQNGMLKETLATTKVILSRHFTELQTSPWRGLPELTNSNGSYCRDSSRTQAWSMACILEVLYDLQQIESKQIVLN